MGQFTKEDVEYHGTNMSYNPAPAVNVKVQGYVTDAMLHKVAAEQYGYDATDADIFVAWWNAQTDDYLQGWYEFACESGWEDLQSDAEYIYGSGVKVYSTGRSGGWAYIDGMRADNVDGWDAIELGRWARFAKYARAIADGIPESAAILALINVAEGYIIQVHKDADRMRYGLVGAGL